MIDIYETENGWAYRVQDVVQEFHPEKPGYEPMTRDEAERFAAIVSARLGQ